MIKDETFHEETIKSYLEYTLDVTKYVNTVSYGLLAGFGFLVINFRDPLQEHFCWTVTFLSMVATLFITEFLRKELNAVHYQIGRAHV